MMKRNIIIGLLLAAAAWCGMCVERKACQHMAVIPFQLPDPPEDVDPCKHYAVDGYDCEFTPNKP